MFGFSLDEKTPQSSAPATQQAANCSKLLGNLGQNYNKKAKEFKHTSLNALPLTPMELLST